MILLEEYIELKIYHKNELRTYDVLEMLKENSELSFKVLYKGDYQFTLIPKKDDGLRFNLSRLDEDLDIDIEWNLYSKIEGALYSVFLKEEPS